MDVLKKSLLILFYVLVIAAGIAGFLFMRSMQDHTRPLQQQTTEPSVTQADKPERPVRIP